MTDRNAVLLAMYGFTEPVAKAMTPQEKRERTQARVGLASNVVGIGAGLAATPGAVAAIKPAIREARGLPKNVPVGARKAKVLRPIAGSKAIRTTLKTLKKPKVVAGLVVGNAALQVANVGGDAVANRVLARSANDSPKKARVHKGDLPIGQKVKLKAIDVAETQVREKAPIAAKAAKKGAQAAKESWTVSAKVSKAIEDKRQVFGWASITEMGGEPVVDLQGDYVTIEEIEKAAYTYVTKSRKGGDMHRRDGENPVHVADLIESVVITPEKKEALGLPGDSPTGWWVGMQVHDDETWQLVKDGKRPMFSVHGSGRRVDTMIDAPVLVGKVLVPKGALKATRLAAGSAKDHVEHAIRDPKGYGQFAGKRIKFRAAQAKGESTKVRQGVKRGFKAGDKKNVKPIGNIQGPRYAAGYKVGTHVKDNKVAYGAGAVAAGAGTGLVAGGTFIRRPEKRPDHKFNPYE